MQKHEENKFEVSNSCNKLIHEKLPRITTKNYQLTPVTILLRLDCQGVTNFSKVDFIKNILKILN